MLPLSSRKPCFRVGWTSLYAEHGCRTSKAPMAHRGWKKIQMREFLDNVRRLLYNGAAIMKVFTYTQARQQLSAVLDTARKEKVVIMRRGNERFSLSAERLSQSPFDIPGVKTKATTDDILDAIRASRSGRKKP